MLRRTLAPGVLCLSLVVSGSLARAEQGKGPTAVGKPVGFAVSGAARDLPIAEAPSKLDRGAEWERENDRLPKSLNPKPGDVRDEALQSPLEAPEVSMPPTVVSFDGLSSQDNFDAFGGRVYPPDTNGAVGPSHYMQQTNLLVRVWDKSGTPLTSPFTLSSLFSTLGGQCAAPDEGDPVVLYDQMADRWVLSQFAFAAISTPPYHECIAISTTADPTGTYYLYDFVTPGNEFPDYPKLGVWPDGYYMTTNQFLNGGSFDGAGVFAFERVKMLAGDPAATLIYFNLSLSAHPEGIGGMLPSSLDGLTLPPAGAPNTFAYFTATLWGDPSNAIRLFDFHADFAIPGSSTFTERSESPVAVAAFDPRAPNSHNVVEQPPPAGSSNFLDVISDRLMHRLAYRNFGSSQSLVLNHTVNVSGVNPTTAGTEQAGIRFYELKRTGSTWAVDQQSTYNPGPINGSTGPNYWMGSAAMDNQGNLALGYSVSSTTIFPSIRYNGRLAGDPPGLSFAEGTMATGSGVQLGTQGRWGDYSAMVVDPSDDCTFWYTTEYYTAASQASSSVGWLTHIASFKFPSCTASPRGTLKVTVKDCGTSATIAGVTVQAGGYFAVTNGSGVATFPPMAPGSYTVNASKTGYLTGTGPATVTGGGTVNVDVCITAVPVLQNAGATLGTESCSPGNGVIDPSESVTVSFCVTNIGAKDTTNLVGTLQATGGVTSPGGPQTFGVVAAGGAAVCRDFTFTAGGTCGGMVTATLNLVDGSFGSSAVYTFTEGVLQTRFSQNFDGVTAPALPSGWVAANASGPSPLWVTSTTSPDSAPNDAFVDDPGAVSDKRLDSPSIAISTSTAALTFRNKYDLEGGFDGGVLEISISGGAFSDIVAAGGSFVSGGYNGTISTSFGSPIPGRQAWTGNSGGYITTVVNLPVSAAGHNVVLRWRMGSDSSVGVTGWRIDGIQITDGYVCCVAGSFTPQALAVDAHSGTGSTGNSNGVLEPGERVVVEPSWRNETSGSLSATGTASSLSGPTGTYAINDSTSGFGSVPAATTRNCFSATGDCFQLTVQISGSRPATHWDATFHDTLSTGAAKTWTLHVGNSFTDVPASSGFYRFVETMLHKGITGGCTATTFCPNDPVTRAQAAVFLLVSEHGPGYTPPTATGLFADVPVSSPFARWIERLVAENITAGCGGGNYCPNNAVTRAQVAVFLLKAEHGISYVPPPATGLFADVPVSSGFARWIEQLVAEGITAGCGGGNYCPSNPVTRAQNAVFLTVTFGLKLYGP